MVGLGALWWGWLCCGAVWGELSLLSAPGSNSGPSPPPDRAEFRAEVLQKKQEERLAAQDSVQELEEHRRLMAWNDEENARQQARRSAQLSPPCRARDTALPGFHL